MLPRRRVIKTKKWTDCVVESGGYLHYRKTKQLCFLACNNMFLNQTTYLTGTNSAPYSVAVADVNSDNKPDIVVANNGSNNVGVLLQRRQWHVSHSNYLLNWPQLSSISQLQ